MRTTTPPRPSEHAENSPCEQARLANLQGVLDQHGRVFAAGVENFFTVVIHDLE